MRVIVSKRADKDLSKLNPFVRKKVLKVLRKFENGERVDIKKMRGESNQFRIRVGEYRILLRKTEDNYCVDEVGKRENIYFFGLIS